MKYTVKTMFEQVNLFGTGMENTMFADYFQGKSFLNPLVKPGEVPVFLANVTFEPGCRNHWHIHQATQGGGQLLICTAGEGWYQEDGKKPISLSEGAFVVIPAGVKHWHGAKKDSWFSHISVEIPGKGTSIEWLEPVQNEVYNAATSTKSTKIFDPLGKERQYKDKKAFNRGNMFGTGIYNFMLKKYFSGRSYLKMMAMPKKSGLFLANVTFEPGCRNHWHIHQATQGGGQILICTAGEGWYQEEGKEAVELKAGTVVVIPAGVKHWHGAKSDTWFSHIAIEVPGENTKNVWCEPVTEQQFNQVYK